MTDVDAVGSLFLEIGILELARRQLSGLEPPPGMRPTEEGVEILLGLAVADLGCDDSLGIYVTHDAIPAVLAAHLLRLSIDDIPRPRYLDGLLIWRWEGGLHLSWRGLDQGSHPL